MRHRTYLSSQTTPIGGPTFQSEDSISVLNAKTRKHVLDLKKPDLALNYGVRGHKGSLEPIPAASEAHARRSSVSPSKRAGLETIGPTVDAHKRLPSIF